MDVRVSSIYSPNFLNRWPSAQVGELYSLVRFLRIDPHAFYQCRSKGCDCKSLNYRFGPEWRACVECGHTPIMHYANFNRHILNPIS